MRLFFCAPLDDSARSRVAKLLEKLQRAAGGGRLTWVLQEQLHFTLAFLGEQDPAAVERALAAARPCAELPAFEAALHGAGGFPNERRPHVLWLGLRAGASEMAALADKLHAGLRAAGFTLEDRPFHAHLTLARVRPGGERAAARALAAAPLDEIARLRIARLVLMESTLSAQGPRHTPLHEVALR